MNFLSKPSTSLILLAVIAVLLLVLVVQGGSRKAPHGPMMTASQPMGQEAPFQGGGGGMPPQGHPPMDGGSQDQNFDPVMMYYAAMACPGDATLSLDSTSCTGKDADDRRAFVRQAHEKDSGIRAVFDAIVEKFGEGALTEQARAIRRARKN